MPNWCDNNVKVSGSEKDITSFKVFARGREQSYNSMKDLEGSDWGDFDDIRVAAIFSNTPVSDSISEFSFHALYPVPENIRILPYAESNAKKVCEILRIEYPGCGYEWETNNWGVKWGGNSVSISDEGKGYIQYSMATPWAPPIPFLEKVAANWPTLNFHLEYCEAGMGFRGEVRFEKGKLVSNFEESFDHYDENDEDFYKP